MIRRAVEPRALLRIQVDEDSGGVQVAVPPALANDDHWDKYGETFLQALMDHLAEIAGEEEEADDAGA